MQDVVQVGAGTVFRDRYIAAAQALDAQHPIRFRHVIDVQPEHMLRPLLERAGLNSFEYHHLASGSASELIWILRDRELWQLPVIVSTPTPSHAPLATALLASATFVALEKPLASSPDHLSRLDESVRHFGLDRLFVFGYYLIEKGLPLLALARSGELHPIQLDMLDHGDRVRLNDLRQRLGPAIEIEGVLIEGPDERSWVMQDAAGGHTLETFSHLISLTLPWFSALSVQSATLARLRDHGPHSAEILTSAVLVGNDDVPCRLLSLKQAPPSLCARWFYVKFERGDVLMNLDTEQMRVRIGGESFVVRLKKRVKYEPQFRQLVEKLHDRSFPVEYELSARSARLAMTVRQLGIDGGWRQISPADVRPGEHGINWRRA